MSFLVFACALAFFVVLAFSVLVWWSWNDQRKRDEEIIRKLRELW